MSKSFAKTDSVTGVDIGISYAHHEIHGGSSFICGIVDLTLASAATMILAFKTPAGAKHIHVFKRFITLTGGHVELISGPTWTNQTGSLVAISNRFDGQRSSVILEDQAQAGFVASDNMIGNPTGLAGGTVINSADGIYAFGQKNQFSGAARETEEFILTPDTQYAFKFTSDAASNKAQMILDWYEHTHT